MRLACPESRQDDVPAADYRRLAGRRNEGQCVVPQSNAEHNADDPGIDPFDNTYSG